MNIAVVCANGLGDALLSMILSHNLTLSGFRVTTFSTALCGLKEWFPSHTILPFANKELYATFDSVIVADHACPPEDGWILLKEDDFDKACSMVENLQEVCQKRLFLPSWNKYNGLTIPPTLHWRLNKKRIVIHPMSTDPNRTWPVGKFIELGRRLEKRGFTPYFCMSPTERDLWLNQIDEEWLPLFPTLIDLAAFLYESGSMIGNNSGIGHLASAMGIPTLTLFARKSYSRLWRPGWGPGLVVTPPQLLPGAYLKQRYWKGLLSVGRVLHALKKMGVEY